MKVYVSCDNRDCANEVANHLYLAGHEVVSTWHLPSEPPPTQGDVLRWQVNAMRNFEQIRCCEVFVLVASPEHVARTKMVTGGKFVEAGYASSRSGMLVYTVGGVENGMLHHPYFKHVATVAELIKTLETK